MSVYVDRAGVFRGVVTEYGVKKHTKEGSESYSLNVRVALHELYDSASGEWIDWREYEMTADGYLNIVKKDGSLNESQVVPIMEHGGWDGLFSSLYDQAWKPTPCQFDIKWDDYGDGMFKVNWFAAHDRGPVGLGNCDEKMAKDLDTRLRSSLKAISGNIKRAKSKPEGKPPSPLAAKTAKPDVPAPPDDDIPF